MKNPSFLSKSIAGCTSVAFILFLFGCDTSASDPSDAAPLPLGATNCSNLASFSKESKTFQLAGSSESITIVVEGYPEKINGYDVVRSRVIDRHPDGLGEYIGCSNEQGFLDVATDGWNPAEPNNAQYYERYTWEPPLFTCKFGDPVDLVCEWSGLSGGTPEREVSRVLSYESIDLPYGKLDNVMKIESSSYDEFGRFAGPTLFWLDQSLGLVRASEAGTTLELLSYTPPVGGKQLATPLPSFTIQRHFIRRMLQSKYSFD